MSKSIRKPPEVASWVRGRMDRLKPLTTAHSLDITQLPGYSSVMTYTVETATETRTFTTEQDAKDWQATQPAGSSRY